MIKNWFRNKTPSPATPDVAELQQQIDELLKRQNNWKRVDAELSQIKTLLELRGIELKIPPPRLQARVGRAHNRNFFKIGHRLGRDVEGMLARAGAKLNDFRRMLDFGCGCGRVLIPLSMALKQPSRLFGSDIDDQAIAWCREHLDAIGGVAVNPHRPPAPFDDGFFDCVYGISVFTHLPEDMQFAWLEDLQRVTASGALLVLTFHGQSHHEKLPEHLRAKLATEGFFYSGAKRGSTPGLPDFYQTSFHTHDYVSRRWGEFFEVLEVRANAVGSQDAALLRRR